MYFTVSRFNLQSVIVVIIAIFFSFILSACEKNDNSNANRHTENKEIAPLGEGQSVNDAYPTSKSQQDYQSNSTEISSTKNSSIKNITVDFSYAVEPAYPLGRYISYCQVVILQSGTSYSPSSHRIDFYATTYNQIINNVSLNKQYLGGLVVYNKNIVIANERGFDTVSNMSIVNSTQIAIDVANITNFDNDNYNYYVLSICANSDTQQPNANVTYYSDTTSVQPVSIDKVNKVGHSAVSLVLPVRRTQIAEQPQPTSSTFTTNINFAQGVSVPKEDCQYIVLGVPKSQTYDKTSKLNELFTLPIAQLKSLSTTAPNNVFLNGTIIYTNANETLQQDPEGQIYVSASVIGANLDLAANSYYPILVCDTVYSDFEHTSSFTSSDGLNIDTNNVNMTSPSASIQPSEDPIFGDNSSNLTSPLAAFSTSDSQYNFVVDLGNMPDPQNATCKYVASINYGINSQNPILPQNLSDFQTLYPGGAFGNSEPNGVIALVKNPIIKHSTTNPNMGANSGYYLGMRSKNVKPAIHYINVALCNLAGDYQYIGVTDSGSPTYNIDTAQVLHFNVTYSDIPSSHVITPTDPFFLFNDNAQAKRPDIQLVPDNTIPNQDLQGLLNGSLQCNNATSTFTYYAFYKNQTGNFYNVSATSINDFLSLSQTLNNSSGVQVLIDVKLPQATASDAAFYTDYQNIYLKWDISRLNSIGTLPFQGGCDFKNVTTPQSCQTLLAKPQEFSIFFTTSCDYGTGAFVTDISKLISGSLTRNATQSNRMEFSPHPYKVYITRAR